LDSKTHFRKEAVIAKIGEAQFFNAVVSKYCSDDICDLKSSIGWIDHVVSDPDLSIARVLLSDQEIDTKDNTSVILPPEGISKETLLAEISSRNISEVFVWGKYFGERFTASIDLDTFLLFLSCAKEQLPNLEALENELQLNS